MSDRLRDAHHSASYEYSGLGPNEREPMKYAVVMERAEHNFSAFVPDLPGCIATAGSIIELEQEIKKAISFHIDGLREDGMTVPEPNCSVEYVEV